MRLAGGARRRRIGRAFPAMVELAVRYEVGYLERCSRRRRIGGGLTRIDPMKVVADLCIVPMGVGPSVSSFVREIKAIIDASALDAEMHANGTNIEGELADICRLVELCEEKLADLGVQRVFYTLIFSSRRDKAQSMADKLNAVR